jgi:hypothetical protein
MYVPYDFSRTNTTAGRRAHAMAWRMARCMLQCGQISPRSQAGRVFALLGVIHPDSKSFYPSMSCMLPAAVCCRSAATNNCGPGETTTRHARHTSSRARSCNTAATHPRSPSVPPCPTRTYSNILSLVIRVRSCFGVGKFSLPQIIP